MTCPTCGTANADGAAFCANCGSGLSPAGGAVATAAAPGGAGGVPPVVMEPGGDQLLAMVKKELGHDYRIEKELGRGGMAVVYKGVETALERVVAIKVVPPESANAGQAAERFRREARLAASLDHANIIPVYRDDVGVVERSSESGFATESLRRLPCVGTLRRDDLDGDDAFERGLYPFVDDGHAAAAELFLDSVIVAELLLD